MTLRIPVPQRIGLWAGASLLFAVAWALRLWHVAATPLWLDEAYNIHLSSAPLAEFLRLAPGDCRPPLYYLLLRGWMALFGSSELAARSLDATAGALTAPLAMLAGRAVVGTRAGWIAGLMMMVAPEHLAESRRAEMYAVFPLLGVLCVWAAHRAVAAGGLRHHLLWGVAAAALLWMHYWAAFFLLGVELAVLLTPRAPRYWHRWLIGHGLLVALLLPLLPLALCQFHNPGQTWMSRYSLHGGLRAALVTFAGGDPSLRTGGAPAVVLAVVIAVALAVALRSRTQLRPLARVAVVLLVPLLAALTASMWRPLFIPGRYTLVLLPAFCWCVGALLAPMPGRWPAALTLVLVVVQAGVALPRVYSPVPLAYRSGGERIAREARTGDAVVYVGLDYEPLRYYVSRRAKSVSEYVYPPALALHSGWMDESEEARDIRARRREATALAARLEPSARRGARLFVLTAQSSSLSRALNQELDRRFRPVGGWSLLLPGGTTSVRIYRARPLRNTVPQRRPDTRSATDALAPTTGAAQ